MNEPIDSFDRQILSLVQQNCHVKAETLGEQVGLSASAVQRRLKRLRESGAIKAEIAVIDRKIAGSPMIFIAGLEIDRENYDALAKFKAWAERQKHVQQVYYVTGTVDLVAIITAADVQHYDSITAEMMAVFPQIKRINTNVVLNDIKIGLHVPVNE